ncbi:helix-turn-helix transcriptional regulator [Anaerococcus urinomassiliensis]|uniref:helix-turn-helix transcriptional regulator n=1 Tax=Anaerococcus urinomassiliensis TaxID=1745712 RepID=UPI00093F4393
MKLINNLSFLRKEKGINQTDLGRLVGVSRQTISLIERGDYNPSVMVALSLAKVFDVSVEDIFTLEEDNE